MKKKNKPVIIVLVTLGILMALFFIVKNEGNLGMTIGIDGTNDYIILDEGTNDYINGNDIICADIYCNSNLDCVPCGRNYICSASHQCVVWKQQPSNIGVWIIGGIIVIILLTIAYKYRK